MGVACLWNKYDPDPLRCYLTAPPQTRSHQALTCDQGGPVGTQSLRSVQAWAKCELPAGQALREPARKSRLFLIGQKADIQILLDAVWTTPAGSDHRCSRAPPSLNV